MLSAVPALFGAAAGFAGLRIAFAIQLIFPIGTFLFASRLEQ